jgi:hypothetical protein
MEMRAAADAAHASTTRRSAVVPGQGARVLRSLAGLPLSPTFDLHDPASMYVHDTVVA